MGPCLFYVSRCITFIIPVHAKDPNISLKDRVNKSHKQGLLCPTLQTSSSWVSVSHAPCVIPGSTDGSSRNCPMRDGPRDALPDPKVALRGDTGEADKRSGASGADSLILGLLAAGSSLSRRLWPRLGARGQVTGPLRRTSIARSDRSASAGFVHSVSSRAQERAEECLHEHQQPRPAQTSVISWIEDRGSFQERAHLNESQAERTSVGDALVLWVDVSKFWAARDVNVVQIGMRSARV